MPWDKAAVLESVRKTSKVLVLHEDTRTGGFGAEIAATIAEEAFEDLDAPVKRLAAPDTPVPFSPPLEKAFIPQVDDVATALYASSRSTRREQRMATETAIDVVMPQMGVSVSEGTITRWLKQEGEHVEADEPLLEISTDKVDTEVPSPASGTLTQILVQEGETVDVGTKLGQIGGSATAEAPAPESAPEPEAAPEPATAEAAAAAEAASPAETPAPTAPEPSAAPSGPGNGKTFVSPVVARIASEHGVDPSQVSGHRPRRPRDEEGHPRLRRVRRRAAAARWHPSRRRPRLRRGSTAGSRPDSTGTRPAASAASAEPPAPAPVAAGEALPGETVEPMTAMRRGIAEHMRRSLDTVRARHERDRGRHVAHRRRARAS